MKIYNDVLKNILYDMPLVPPEAGGILGGKGGKICLWAFDPGYYEKGCVYRPNVNYMNKTIEKWMNSGYEFMGILHVHFGGSTYLSDGDKIYIKEIMNAMPDSVKQLYFPLVVQPGGKLISYIAVRNMEGETEIVSDDIELICR